MGATSTISSKGQITVPVEIRNRLGVKAGDRVEFAQENGFTILRPARDVDDPFAEFVGCLPGFATVDESTAWVRNMRDPDGDDL